MNIHDATETAYRNGYAKGREDALTADAVEVVRCKDCDYRKTPNCAMWYQCDKCGGQWSWETENDFCSYGERREV